MALAVVWVSSWQMECCGDPFAVGDTVSLHLDAESDTEWYESALGSEMARRITHAEEHHQEDEEYPEFTGHVLGIQRSWCAFGPTGADERVHYPIPGTARFENVDRIDLSLRSSHPELNFNGWVVDLELDDDG